MEMLHEFRRCPVCFSPVENSEPLFRLGQLGHPSFLLKCGQCGLVYKKYFLSQEALGSIYGRDYVHFSQDQRPGEPIARSSAADKIRMCRHTLGDRGYGEITMLDVGCGDGHFVDAARELGVKAYGIDPNLPADRQNKYLQEKV